MTSSRTADDGGKPSRRQSGIGVRAVLSALVIVTGVATAALVHGGWTWTANRNLRDVVSQLNRQIVVAVQQELSTLLAGAESAREALRTIFFQGVIETRDEAKREFIVLSLLQSHPSFSWVAIGWPNGDFFGAQKADEREIRMAEVKDNPETMRRELRVDRYRIVPGDIEFRERTFAPSDYRVGQQPWYATAAIAADPVWSEATVFPTRVRPAIATSARLEVYQEYVGVVTVAIELERLSRFLANLSVGKTGAAYIVATDGRVIASSLPLGGGVALSETEMPPWARLDGEGVGASDGMLSITAAALKSGGLSIGDVVDTVQLEHEVAGRLYFITMTPLPFEGWVMATVVPAEDFLGDIAENTRRLLWALGVFVVLVAIGATFASQWVIVRPMRRIVQQLRNVEQFRLDRIERVPSPLREFDQLSAVLVQMGQGLASFQKFLPTELVRILVAQGMQARPGGQYRTLTILFSDLVGFTRLSERLGNDIVPLLADYLGRMTGVIRQTEGTVDKFIGDAVMAFWNAPLDVERHAEAACRAAILSQRMLAAMREEARARGLPELRMRLGVNTGEVLVGNIGSDERLNYTVIGDPVNIAARLEPLNKKYGTEILIGEDTRRAAADAIVVRRIGKVAVYGRTEGLTVYELLGLAAEVETLGPLDWVADYERGLDHYEARRFAEARVAFGKVLAARPGDGPARLMERRAAGHEAIAPPADWAAVETQDDK